MAQGRVVVGDTPSEVVQELVRVVNDLIKAAEVASDGDAFRVAAAALLGVSISANPPNAPKHGVKDI